MWNSIVRFFKSKPAPPAAAAELLSALPGDVVSHQPHPMVAFWKAASREGHLGLQGYAPIVTVSRNRHGTKCECGRVVLRNVRHICVFNAHHHLATLTAEERDQLIADLEALGVRGD